MGVLAVWGRVLSIQSHTVHGYVGNKSAVFPLQLLGFDVDPINSVQFSNHTGYKNGFKGDVLNGDQLKDLVKGLQANDLVKDYTHMLTGYIGSVSFLSQVLDVHRVVKEACPELAYFCDPVLGDKGKLYVPEELVDVYRERVIPVATVLTPNQFELELLSKVKVTDLTSAKHAFAALHARGVQTVILTSCELPPDAGGQGDSLLLLASVARGKGEAGPPRLFQAVQPKVEGHFTGTGDLIAALFLAWTVRTNGDMLAAIRKACTSMHCVVSRTKEAIDAGRNANREILLIESRKDIEEPDVDADIINVTTV
ncbi:N-terminally processed] [Durusdinium trenchii]|uniref:pyridoxal kinase n=1 Tax=Durusdinium trenchii TaxID=1381693 RepID=A0ABP0QZR9_9DINO